MIDLGGIAKSRSMASVPTCKDCLQVGRDVNVGQMGPSIFAFGLGWSSGKTVDHINSTIGIRFP